MVVSVFAYVWIAHKTELCTFDANFDADLNAKCSVHISLYGCIEFNRIADLLNAMSPLNAIDLYEPLFISLKCCT